MGNKWWIMVLLAVVVGVAAFFGGKAAAGGSSSGALTSEQIQNMSPEELRQLMQQVFRAGGGNGGAGFPGGGPQGARGVDNGGSVNGTVLSQDAESLTVKQPDGSTKIIFYSDSTAVATSAQGTIEDVKDGVTVTVTGSTNADGSLTAQRIQIRPEGEPLEPFGPGGPGATTTTS